MRNLPKLLIVALLGVVMGTHANAKGFKLDPTTVVLVQETDIWSVWLCPISSANQFATNCKNRDGFFFNLNTGRGDRTKDIITLKGQSIGVLGVKSVKSTHTGRFAFALGQVNYGTGFTQYYLSDETMVANVAPGTVLIMPYAYGLPSRELKKTLATVKSVFRKRYGSVADQMTYQVMQTKKVSCKESKEFLNKGLKCALR